MSLDSTTDTSLDSTTDTSFDSDNSAREISTYLFEEICSQICENTPTNLSGSCANSNYVSASYTNSNYTNRFSNGCSNERKLMENSCVKKY